MIKCKTCNKPTLTICPLTLKQFKSTYFHVSGLCSVCLNSKSKFLTKKEEQLLPDFVYNVPVLKKCVEYIDDCNGQKIKLITFLEKIINI